MGEERTDAGKGGPRAAVLSARRILRPINWTAYAAAAAGAAHAIFRIDARVELGVAVVLIVVPLLLMGLALAYPGRVRLNSAEGGGQPDGLNAILWSGLVLVLMLAFDPRSILGYAGFWLRAAPLALAYAALWLYTERERLRPVARSYAIVVAAVSLLLMSGAWAAGAVYFVNKHADRSAVEWSQTQVTALRRKGRTAPTFLATLAPWSALREPVELEVPRATYERLRAGAAVEVGVRRGALGVAWVEEVRPAGA